MRIGSYDLMAQVDEKDASTMLERLTRPRFGDLRVVPETPKSQPQTVRRAAFPEFKRLSDWLVEPDIDVTWRIQGWMPAGSRILIAAQYKAGKTTLTGNLLRSLVDSDPFLGDQSALVTALGPDETAVLLDFEMTAHQLKDWLRKQAIKRAESVIATPMRGYTASFNLLTKSALREWATRLRDLNCKFLGIDCLRPVLDAIGLDEHSDAGRFLVPLDELLAEAGIEGCWLVHHMGHEKQRPRGDSRLRDWPDAEVTLIRHGETADSPRFIRAYGRDVDQPERPLLYDEVTRHLTLGDGVSRKRAKEEDGDNTVLQKIVAVLSQEPGLSGLQIHQKVGGHSKNTIYRVLSTGLLSKVLVAEGPKQSRCYYLNVALNATSSAVGGAKGS